jgi:radical SAM protein with 4Fe4S-binding SPASM domain
MKLPKNFCAAPFVQLTTHPTGSFSPCPYLGGTTWRQQYPTVLERWNSEELQSLRDQFLDNQKSKHCERCWYEEGCGKRSLRQRLYDVSDGSSDYGFAQRPGFGADLEKIVADKHYLQGPRVLTIKNGNVCNARCRVCHPGDSSRWIKDAQQLHQITGKTYYNIAQQERNWSDAQVKEIVSMSRNLDRLELFGGEPLYNQQVHAILESIAQQGDAQHITLYINTNGSVDWVKRCPAILEFANVEIGVSIDGVDQQFDYIRNGVQWSEVVANIGKWQQALKGRPHWIDAICTVSALNVYYLPEIRQRVMEILPLAPFWNLLRDPEYLFIGNIPEQAKQQIRQRLTDPEFAEIQSVLDTAADPQRWGEFLEITQALDQIRKESFAETFKEFADIICYG